MHLLDVVVPNGADAEEGISVDLVGHHDENCLKSGNGPGENMHVRAVVANCFARPFHAGGEEPGESEHHPPSIAN